MTRTRRAITAALLLALVITTPALAGKPDKAARDLDGKPGWGPPPHSHHRLLPPGPPPASCGPQRLDLCHTPAPPEPSRPPAPDPEPEPQPEPPITCASGPCLPPIDELPDTALR